MLASKFRCNLTKVIYVNGSNKPSDVAHAFADHFDSVYVNSADAAMAKSEFGSLFLSSSSNNSKLEILFDTVNIELIDKCIRSLKLAMACGLR